MGSHGYHGLLSVDPNTIPGAGLRQRRGCTAGGTPGTTTQHRSPQGAQYIPVGHAAQSVSGRRLLLVHRRQQQLQRAADGRDPAPHATACKFRANYTWSKNLDMNSGLTGAQANNQAQMILDRNDLPPRLGAVGAERHQPGQHLGQL